MYIKAETCSYYLIRGCGFQAPYLDIWESMTCPGGGECERFVSACKLYLDLVMVYAGFISGVVR